MNITRPLRTVFTPAAGYTRSLFAAVLGWHRKRIERQVLEGLSDWQLKDIGYRRNPTGGLDEIR